jgi:hypothetical protein
MFSFLPRPTTVGRVCDLGYGGPRHRSRLLPSGGAKLRLPNGEAHPMLIGSAGLAAVPSAAGRKVRRLESASSAMLVHPWRSGSWNRPRRVVVKVEWYPGELYPRVGFIVTNLTRPTERVLVLRRIHVSSTSGAAAQPPM